MFHQNAIARLTLVGASASEPSHIHIPRPSRARTVEPSAREELIVDAPTPLTEVDESEVCCA